MTIFSKKDDDLILQERITNKRKWNEIATHPLFQQRNISRDQLYRRWRILEKTGQVPKNVTNEDGDDDDSSSNDLSSPPSFQYYLIPIMKQSKQQRENKKLLPTTKRRHRLCKYPPPTFQNYIMPFCKKIRKPKLSIIVTNSDLPTKFTPEEETELIQLYNIYGGNQWRTISQHSTLLQHYTFEQLKRKWYKLKEAHDLSSRKAASNAAAATPLNVCFKVPISSETTI